MLKLTYWSTTCSYITKMGIISLWGVQNQRYHIFVKRVQLLIVIVLLLYCHKRLFYYKQNVVSIVVAMAHTSF